MLSVFYIIILQQIFLPLKKTPENLAIWLTNCFSVKSGIFVDKIVYSVRSFIRSLSACSVQVSAYRYLRTKKPVWWNTFPGNLFGNTLKYLSANLCVWNLVLFIFRWSFKALCSSLLPTDLMFCVLPILATTALKTCGVANQNKNSKHILPGNIFVKTPIASSCNCVFRLFKRHFPHHIIDVCSPAGMSV